MQCHTPPQRNASRLPYRFVALLIACAALFGAAPTLAQMPGGMPGGDMAPAKPRAPDPFLASISRWDGNHDGTLTCDEWKQYANRLFTMADKNANGFVDAAEFQTIRRTERIFADADFAYFDDNHDRRISRVEFVDKPSPFFARYDLNHDCRVTSQELNGTGGAPQGGGPGRGKGGGMPGMGGGRGGF